MTKALDFIGDVHGHAEKLRALLKQLGYRPVSGTHRHPAARRAVFVGDLIDRGPHQIQVLDIVRRMVESGDAVCLLGNHEFNAIGYTTRHARRPDEFLRRHTPGNVRQHAAFLAQVGEGTADHQEWVRWFRTLPVFLDLGDVRAVHAWWYPPHVDFLRNVSPTGTLGSDDLIQQAFRKGHRAYEVMEGLLKGLEAELPVGLSYADANGRRRTRTRVRWWDTSAATFADALILPVQLDDDAMQQEMPAGLPIGYDADAPCFIGHYWMSGEPGLAGARVVCVDYSAGTTGPLVAYRWDGDQSLPAANFVRSDGSVPSSDALQVYAAR
ncbi:metallophosphoesterase [Variovorax sp. LT1P1]|uniref:metallophosphoesterase n=1 Tax=Variovorax sp. LT1P1 TaxID=3443730 RepID=UPI003F46A78B